jgi:hypothetical protein
VQPELPKKRNIRIGRRIFSIARQPGFGFAAGFLDSAQNTSGRLLIERVEFFEIHRGAAMVNRKSGI